MKRYSTLLAILAVVASTSVASEPQLLQLNGRLTPVAQPAQRTLPLKAVAPVHAETPAVAYAASDNLLPDYSEWTVAEGTWFYYSGYTGKSYPTEVRYINLDQYYPGNTRAAIHLTNDLFGSANISTDLITGDTNFYYDYDGYDEYGSQIPVYPELKDENGEPLGVAFRSQDLDLHIPCYGNWAVYPLAGHARILVQTMDKYDGRVDQNSAKPNYDYLYNTQAKDCKIKAEYARSYYNGEKTAKVKLSKGADVTDIYYVMAMQYADEKRSHADPDWNPEEGYGLYPISRGYIAEYIAEFKAGETNDAYVVGHVAPDATEVEIPLPENDGLKDMFIVAYSGDQITDMVFDKIEVRRPYQWRDYGTISINQNITWAYNCETFSVIESGDYKVETNEDGTYYRIVSPFAKNDIPEANYIYLNVQDGRMDKCFIDPSYSPFERTYTFPTPDGTTETLSHPFILLDIIGTNVLNGFYPSDLYTLFNQHFIDLGCGKADEHTFFAQDYNTSIWDKLCSGFIMTNVSAVGTLDMQFSDYLVAKPLGRGISFEAGPEIAYVLCSFDYADSGIMTASTDESDSFRVNIEDGKGQIDILDLLESGKIPSLPVGARISAYKAADKAARTVSVDLSDYTFYNGAMGSVTFTGKSGNLFLDADLMIARRDLGENDIEYEVKDFAKTLNISVDDFSIKFNVYTGDDSKFIYTAIKRIHLGTYNFNIGPGDLYLEFQNMQYNEATDDNNDVVSGKVYAMVYDHDDNDSLWGYSDYATINITIPKKLTQANSTSGIEEVVGEDMDEAQPVYYNLQGIQVDNPQPGTLLIERRGNSARKIIFRN